jgi:hypothetical protein
MDNDFKCDPEVGKNCKNNAMCYLCDGQRLLKLPKPYVPPKNGHKKRKQGMGLEKDVVKKWNQSSLQGIARRTPNSGAIDNIPGDIITSKEIMECKERGTITSKGEKSFTISLDWILKVRREMLSSGKKDWYIPFRFKGHNEIFVIKELDSEIELLETIEELRERGKKDNG